MWALHLAATNQFYHEGQGNPYRENLAMNMGTTGYTEDATPKEVLGRELVVLWRQLILEMSLYCCVL